MSLGVMTAEHPRFMEFKETLSGPGYVNFHEREPGNRETVTWDCTSGPDHTHARRLLGVMGARAEEIEQSIAYFRDHGGYCDCEVIFNVLSAEELRKRPKRITPKRRAPGPTRRNPVAHVPPLRAKGEQPKA